MSPSPSLTNTSSPPINYMSPSPSSTNTMSLPISTNLTSMSPSPSSSNTNYTGSNKPSLKPTNDEFDSSYEPSPSSSPTNKDVSDDGNGDEIVSTITGVRDMIRRISLNMYNTIFG